MASMTTLVTGFEPFGGSNVNSSELVVTALAALGERGVITAVLPTSYSSSGSSHLQFVSCLSAAHCTYTRARRGREYDTPRAGCTQSG